MNTIVGTSGLIEQPQSYGYTQGRGSFSIRTFKITGGSHLTTLLPYLASTGYSYEVTNGAVVTVTARSEADQDNDNPQTEPLQDIWERQANVVERDILQSNVSSVVAVSAENKILLSAALENHKMPLFTGASATDADKLYYLIKSGIKTVLISSPILRHTYITANNYTVQWSDNNVGKILTSGQMTSIEGCPSTVLFNLPTTSAADSTYLTAGFLKKPAHVLQIAGGQWQISQEYLFDLWAKLIYPTV